MSMCRGRKSLICWRGAGERLELPRCFWCHKIVAEGGPENPQLLRGGGSAIEDFGIEKSFAVKGLSASISEGKAGGQ